MSWRRYRFYMLIGTIALVSAWLVKIVEKDERSAKVISESGAEDYFSYGYRKTEMSDLGLRKRFLVADSMMHQSEDGTTHLQNPIMTLYNSSETPWVIQSESGILSADGDNLTLNGKVHINREPGKGVRALTVNTSALRVRLPDSYAETDKWAEIISPPNRTTGIGMKTTFVEPVRLRLLAKVKGRYEVN